MIEVIILEGGVTAREINPYGDTRPNDDCIYKKGDEVITGVERDNIHNAVIANWERAEKTLTTLIIDSEEEALKPHGGKEKFESSLDIKLKSANLLYQPNTKHFAMRLPSGKIKIISKVGLFELKKDINTPDCYIRAGKRKTKEEWEQLFPKAFQFFCNDEWFIDLTPKEEQPKYEKSIVEKLVDEVFDSHGLLSISYRKAAVMCCIEYKKRLDGKK